ncbi:unnamed protein product [Macrosiphum euphorbiae]|uniref:Uncharacterized protein n=1 Tax=Macrosiphum euphorbiae TaxID=13131 RepID=A0AAV0XSF5_9HEMI|nr:unnamed protein product [Macrosiphum euphorbiae]
MTRHIRIKHPKKLKSPIEKSLRGIGKVYGSESRRSVSLIPMDVIRDQLGPYWDDVPYRKIAFKLCVMGRIKAYGGSWGLPDAPTIEDPFAPFRSKNYEDERISTAKCYVSPVVQPHPVSSSPEITVRDDNVAITESQSPYKQVRKQLADKGYQDRLLDNHPIIVLHSRYLEMGHEKDSQACKNYIANVSRVLKFVSTGQRVMKLYEDVNRIYGSQLSAGVLKSKLSACVFRRMIETKSRGHHPEVGKAVAACLQHGESTALKFYRLPDASEAIRRQERINMVDKTAAFEQEVMENFVEIFGNEPYVNMTKSLIQEKLRGSDEITTNSGAEITALFVRALKTR